MPKYLVASCVCDSTGYRIGLVDANGPISALGKLGTEIIKNDDWQNYMARHDLRDLGTEGWVNSKFVVASWAFLDRTETSFCRWLLVAHVEEFPKEGTLICSYNEAGTPKVTILPGDSFVETFAIEKLPY